MSAHKQLDKIINECGVSRYEKAITCGLDKFIESCSESIQKKGNALNSEDLHNLLYLLKYLYQYWPNSERTVRRNKQLCFKALFVFTLSGKQTPGLRQLLKQIIKQISEVSAISPDGYPFLTEEEKNTICSLVDGVSQQVDIHAIFLSLRLERANTVPDYKYIPDGMLEEFIESYKTICSYPEVAKIDAKYLESLFIAVKEQNITKAFPAVLKTLPFYFCMTEIHRLISLLPPKKETESLTIFVSEKNTNFDSRRKLFIKDSGDYRALPIWAKWFFLAGQKAAMAGSTCHNLIIGFSLPTRAYAALFFLLGYETWNAERIMQENEKNESHFNCLSKCEQDEALLIYENNHWKRCWFNGLATVAGEKCIKVEVPGAERRQYTGFISENNIAKLRKAVDPDREVAANQIGFEMSGFDTLISYYKKTENDILNFLIQEKSLYTVIGNKTVIKKELEKEKLFFSSEENYTEMSFQNILRFKNFMTDFDLSRGEILTAQQSNEFHLHTTGAVIYDGSLAFLNHQGNIRGKMEIVFLDRTEPQFSSACSELLTRYVDREEDVNLFDKIPAAVELLVFKE